jgi:hypothetical protein
LENNSSKKNFSEIIKIVDHYIDLIEKQTKKKEMTKIITFFDKILYNFNILCPTAKYDPDLPLSSQEVYKPNIKVDYLNERHDFEYEQKLLKFLRNFKGKKKK